jgi:isovaleryl-CoA dehydrogenase
MGATAHALAMEEVSRISGSIGLSYGVHSAVSMAQILRSGS